MGCQKQRSAGWTSGRVFVTLRLCARNHNVPSHCCFLLKELFYSGCRERTVEQVLSVPSLFTVKEDRRTRGHGVT